MAVVVPLSDLRKGVCRLLGDWLQAATTTNITGTDKYIISTELDPYTEDDYFNSNWWVLLTSGNNAGVCRVIKGFSAANDRIEVYGANLAAETGAVTFELHRFDPAEIARVLNYAILETYPLLGVPVLAPNDHFEDWSQTTYPDYWRVNNVTAVKETGAANIHNGAASAKVTRAGADGYLYISTEIGTGAGKLPLDVYNALLALREQKVVFAKWVKATTALQARLAIYCGSDARTRYSKFHSGGGSFEYLDVEFNIPWDASEVSLRCEVITSDGAVYFDGAGQADKTLVGLIGYLSTVSAETDAMEINYEQSLGLQYWVAATLLQNRIMPISSESVSRYAGDSDRLMSKARQLLRAHRTPIPMYRMAHGWLGELESEG